MEQHEKSAIACEKPVYDAIPLNILDETNGKSYRGMRHLILTIIHSDN